MFRIAQVGVGYWGPNLLRNLVLNPRCEVRTVVDLSLERRKYVQYLYPRVKVSSDFQTVCEDKKIDAVVIATPIGTHFDLARRALQAGKHVLVEKPLARSVAEVEEIGEAATAYGKVAMVGHTFLFNAAVRYVKRLIQSQEVGDVRYIYCQRLNLGRIRSDVDALWSLAPHDISILQYWLDDPSPLSVIKQGLDFVQPGIHDVVFMNLTYPGKIMAHIHVSWLDLVKTRRITVVGSRKMVVFDDVAKNKVTIFEKAGDPIAVLGKNMDYDNQPFKPFSEHCGGLLTPQIEFPEPLKVEIDHFLDCMEKRVECLTGIAHARKVVEILAA